MAHVRAKTLVTRRHGSQALHAVEVQNSEEIYLVSAATDANVKIRDQLLDIKRLERVDEHGLEQWRPELKAAVPARGIGSRQGPRGARTA